MRTFFIFVSIQMVSLIFSIPAFSGGCTPGVEFAMKKFDISISKIDEICSLAEEIDSKLGDSSSDSGRLSDEDIISMIRKHIDEKKYDEHFEINKIEILRKSIKIGSAQIVVQLKAEAIGNTDFFVVAGLMKGLYGGKEYLGKTQSNKRLIFLKKWDNGWAIKHIDKPF